MRESAIEKAVCDYARANGCIVIKNAAPTHRGIPDRLFLRKGVAVFVEFKAPGKRPTELQTSWIKRLTENGFFATWVSSREEGIKIINNTLCSCKKDQS
jgi:Holliday junction resolvase